MNILFFGLPGAARLNPTVAGGFTGMNYAAWLVAYLVFDEKMITIFSMLFGAGLVLMTDRMNQQGRSPAGFSYRRSAILFVIGLAHAYLLWPGDILVSYALCGMLVYPLRKLSPRMLLIVGLLVMLPSVPLTVTVSTLFRSFRDAAERVTEATKQGDPVTERDRDLAQSWENIRKDFHPAPAEITEEITAYHALSYWKLILRQAPAAFEVQTTIFGAAFVWMVSGRMLIGMALMKLGVFSIRRSMRFYWLLVLFGYGLGWPIVACGANRQIESNFDVVYLFGGGMEFNNFASIPVALGHIGVVMLVVRVRLLTWLTDRLAAAGRMALSNYLMQSLLCMTFFSGYGFGYFGAFDRVQLCGIVAVIWALQLWYSLIWLRYFQFGPVEWLWRSLTYGTVQPMLKSCEGATAG